MTHYMLRYVGADSLPSRLSDFDLKQYFQLSQNDIRALSDRFRADRRVGAAIQLLFLRAAGRPFDRYASIPRSLLRYVGEALRVAAPGIASLRAIYERRQTLYEHQAWARDYLDLKDVDQEASDQLETYLQAHANEVVSIDELVKATQHWLYQHRLLILGERAIRDLARRCYDSIEQKIHRAITDAIPATTLYRCRQAVYERHDDQSYTVLEWLKTPPKRHSPTTLSETLDKIAFLKGLGVDGWKLDAIPLEKQRGYAQQMQVRRPTKSKEIKETTAVIELVFFLRITLLELTDSAIYQSGRRVSGLIRQAYHKTQSKQARSSVTYRERLLSIKAIVHDEQRSAEERLSAVVALLEDISDKPQSSHAASMRETLIEDANKVRALLRAVDGLSFEGRPNETTLQNLAVLKGFYAGKVTELPQDQAPFTDKGWRDLVSDPDRKRAFQALEAATMMGLSKGLRRGSIWVSHSFSYRDRDQMLIPPKTWNTERDRHLSLLKLPKNPDEFLDPLVKMIEAGLAALAEAKEKGIVEIRDDGYLHLSPLQALPDDGTPRRTVELMFRQIGDVQLPDLMMEIDAQTNFSEILLGWRAKDEHELVSLYAALIAHGTEIDAKSVAAMIPQLDPAHVSSAMRALETPGRLRRASEAVVDFQMKHEIAALWGNGEKASSDMMSLDASQHLWNARVDPRRRTHAVGIYTHVQDRYGIIYDQPIVLQERQAGAAIQGVVHYNNSEERIRLQLLAVDTHGYTNVAMAIAKLLGFDLCPRLRDLAERKLYLPRKLEAPEELERVLIKEVSLTAIRKGWDELLRLVASIRSGRVSANVALQRFGSAAHGDPLHKAADHLGKLLRTLFLCDYLSNTDFRREIHTVLNRGETVHQLQRAVYYGKVPPERGRRANEMIAISGSHVLLTNLVIAWNTHRMQDVVDRWRKLGQVIDDTWLRRMGPVHFSHINFRGTFRFGVDRYADALLQSLPKSSRLQRA
ncbi:MAG TPA: Tn3 family transposase [Noviherbaspirillum sp.]|nr:Tn3 family transposase [Noviherbaspirillum sp.]